MIGKEWAVESKIVQKIRVAQFDASTVRIVLDGATMKDVATANLEGSEPHVLDVADPRAPAAPARDAITQGHHDGGARGRSNAACRTGSDCSRLRGSSQPCWRFRGAHGPQAGTSPKIAITDTTVAHARSRIAS